MSTTCEVCRAKPATVHVETSPLGSRIVATTELEGLRIIQHTTLLSGIDRVDVTTHVDGSIGQDHLLRNDGGHFTDVSRQV